ncbi:hypothetical protein IQ268_08830 [Oculatella sp. LEGE 06141]|uniref:hypothetical protein n=1 Tax=Oculatella sp. LEGE 06141 TaxID=1828648 RepID=UPI0018801DBF|nr:hypothetical protein [Oculatella sp. LEGE 06141]MBE9178662.1 hypothetical protein [Oculatella sp. LEGE 06141]
MATQRGIAYPLQIENGTLKLAEDVELTRCHILSVLETEPLERIMQPQYGTPDLLFNAVPDVHLTAQTVRQALEREVSNIEFNVTGRIGENGAAIVSIYWTVNGLPQPPLNFQLAN